MKVFLKVDEDCRIPLRVITYYATTGKKNSEEGYVKFESKQKEWEGFKKSYGIQSEYICIPKLLAGREEVISLLGDNEIVDTDKLKAFFVTDGIPIRSSVDKKSGLIPNLFKCMTKMQLYGVSALINIDDPRVVFDD